MRTLDYPHFEATPSRVAVDLPRWNQRMMSVGEEEVKKEEKRWDAITQWASRSVRALRPGTLVSYLRKLGSGEITVGGE